MTDELTVTNFLAAAICYAIYKVLTLTYKILVLFVEKARGKSL